MRPRCIAALLVSGFVFWMAGVVGIGFVLTYTMSAAVGATTWIGLLLTRAYAFVEILEQNGPNA